MITGVRYKYALTIFTFINREAVILYVNIGFSIGVNSKCMCRYTAKAIIARNYVKLRLIADLNQLQAVGKCIITDILNVFGNCDAYDLDTLVKCAGSDYFYGFVNCKC